MSRHCTTIIVYSHPGWLDSSLVRDYIVRAQFADNVACCCYCFFFFFFIGKLQELRNELISDKRDSKYAKKKAALKVQRQGIGSAGHDRLFGQADAVVRLADCSQHDHGQRHVPVVPGRCRLSEHSEPGGEKDGLPVRHQLLPQQD